MSDLTWNVSAECHQLADRLDRLSEKDHRSATVDANGDRWLKTLDRLQESIIRERHKAAQALVALGY